MSHPNKPEKIISHLNPGIVDQTLMKLSGQFSSSMKAEARTLQTRTDTRALPFALKFMATSRLSREQNASMRTSVLKIEGLDFERCISVKNDVGSGFALFTFRYLTPPHSNASMRSSSSLVHASSIATKRFSGLLTSFASSSYR